MSTDKNSKPSAPGASGDHPPAKVMTKAGARTSTKATAKAEPTPVLVVRGPAAGFRRAGHRFGPDPVQLSPEALGEDRVAAILAEPRLVAELREEPAGQGTD